MKNFSKRFYKFRSSQENRNLCDNRVAGKPFCYRAHHVFCIPIRSVPLVRCVCVYIFVSVLSTFRRLIFNAVYNIGSHYSCTFSHLYNIDTFTLHSNTMHFRQIPYLIHSHSSVSCSLDIFVAKVVK